MSTDVRPGHTGDDPPVDEVLLERLTAQLDRYADRPRGPETHQRPPAEPDQSWHTFEAIVGGLRAESAWSEPPASLRELILAQVRDSAAVPDAVPTEVPDAVVDLVPEVAPDVVPEAVPDVVPEAVPDVVPEIVPDGVPDRRARSASRPARWRPRWQRLAWAVPVAAFAAAVFTVGVLATERALAPGDAPGDRYTATGTQLAAGATASVSISPSGSGFVVVVEPTGLPAAAPGSYYAAWLRGPKGVVPLGSFHEHQAGGAVRLWSGVDPVGYATFIVTLQAEGEPPAPSDLVVLTATLRH